MLRYEVCDTHGTQPLTFHVGSRAIATEVTRGEVRLLRRKTFKGTFFTPVVASRHVLLLFPNSCAPGNNVAGPSSSSVSSSSARSSVGITYEAAACISRLLTAMEHIPFHIEDAVACAFSGCAVLLLECPTMEDVLSVQDCCDDVAMQTNDLRTSNLYVRSFSCSDAGSVAVDAKVLETHYYIPTCPLCGDRLESTVSGYAPLPPLCTCAQSGNVSSCTCFLISSCLVCRRFAESVEQARRAQSQEQPSSQPAIKCEACAKAGDPWICLLCGYVGCSRYQAMHAKDHCVAQQHYFSMNLLTQQIWDYDGDCFVHRVIILLDSHTGSSTRMRFPGREDPLLDGAGAPFPSAESMKSEKKNISAKYDKSLNSSHTQYAMVIKSELDAKRLLYEAQLREAEGRDAEGQSPTAAVYTGADRDGVGEENWDADMYVDLAKAFDPVDAVLADIIVRRRNVTVMGYAVRNLQHELGVRAEETRRLEAQVEERMKDMRRVIQQNVTNDLQLSTSIHELRETLQDIALNASTQRRLAARLGDTEVSRMVVMGSGQSAPASAGGSRKKKDGNGPKNSH